MKILASAFACLPDGSAEDMVGWGWVEALAQFHDVWVLTNADRRESLESCLAAHPLPHVHWIFQDIPPWLRPLTNREPNARIHYATWQWEAYQQALRLHREIGFDLVHHLTFVQYWTPSYLSLLPLPFVWGPLGGGESAPRSFYRSFGLRGYGYEVLRDMARIAGEWHPLLRYGARKTILALATTPETAMKLRRLGARNVQIMPAVKLTTTEIERYETISERTSRPFRVLSAGRLLHWKGFYLGLQAFARHANRFSDSEYWLAGDGPDGERLQALAADLGISDRVKFLGHVPRDGLTELLAKSDILLHPSLHDSGGRIVLEAMAAGRPVVCLGLGGPQMMVMPNAGFSVEATNPERSICEIASALDLLATHEDMRKEFGRHARAVVRANYSWESATPTIASLYDMALRPSLS